MEQECIGKKVVSRELTRNVLQARGRFVFARETFAADSFRDVLFHVRCAIIRTAAFAAQE